MSIHGFKVLRFLFLFFRWIRKNFNVRIISLVVLIINITSTSHVIFSAKDKLDVTQRDSIKSLFSFRLSQLSVLQNVKNPEFCANSNEKRLDGPEPYLPRPLKELRLQPTAICVEMKLYVKKNTPTLWLMRLLALRKNRVSQGDSNLLPVH